MAVPSDSLAQVLAGQQADGDQPPIDETRIASRWGIVFRRFRRRRLAMFGLTVILLLFVLAFVGPYLSQWSYTDHDFNAFLQGPSLDHWFGTTQTGGDVYALTLRGMQKSLIIGLLVALFSTGLAALVGSFAGYLGGWVDRALMRLADLVLGLPFLPFVIVLVALIGASLQHIVFAVALLLWPNAARVIRSQVLTLAQRQFIEAARVTGASEWRIMFVHIAPNIVPLAFLYGSIAVGWAILTEASLSFLGFGKADTISWGTMLQDAYASQALDRQQFAWFVPPGICLVLVVLAGFLISRGYEELLFPKLREG
jgi:peptide/nickel transport system permease protein